MVVIIRLTTASYIFREVLRHTAMLRPEVGM